jgi:mono/diheme cytochrome c family protein
LVPTLFLLGCLALLPLVLVARARSVKSPLPRIHVVQDMDDQGKFKSQQPNPLFADGRATRAPVAGTVARGQLREDDVFFRGVTGEAYATEIPTPITTELLERGKERYGINCSPCHGLSGYGDGIVARRADKLQQGTWVPPTSFHAEPAASRAAGHIFNTITNGIRNMPAYGSQIPAEDRWAIVAYVKALQRSQKSGIEDVPPDLRSSLR